MGKRRLEVFWTEAAVSDLEAITSYVAQEAPGRALRLVARLQKRAEALETLPHRGRVVPELATFGIKKWRELVARPYRIIYAPTERGVFVYAVLDGRRDLSDLLFERLLR